MALRTFVICLAVATFLGPFMQGCSLSKTPEGVANHQPKFRLGDVVRFKGQGRIGVIASMQGPYRIHYGANPDSDLCDWVKVRYAKWWGFGDMEEVWLYDYELEATE